MPWRQSHPWQEAPLQSSDLSEINVSMQALVRRAYDLGRSDALKKVVDVLNADQNQSERLALMAPPVAEPSLEHPDPANDAQPASEPESVEVTHRAMTTEPTPWWAWKVR